MATELSDLAIPAFVGGLKNLSNILDKAEAFATGQGLDPGELLGARLVEDMGPLTRQVQLACDTAKGVAVRLGGIDPVPMADEETTFADLHARIDKTIAALESVPPGAMNGKEGAHVAIVTPNRTLQFTGSGYLLGFALPNFYFHVTAAYAILRMKGVQIGKADYLGGI